MKIRFKPSPSLCRNSGIHANKGFLLFAAVVVSSALLTAVFSRLAEAKSPESETAKIEALIHGYEKSIDDADTALASEIGNRARKHPLYTLKAANWAGSGSSRI